MGKLVPFPGVHTPNTAIYYTGCYLLQSIRNHCYPFVAIHLFQRFGYKTVKKTWPFSAIFVNNLLQPWFWRAKGLTSSFRQGQCDDFVARLGQVGLTVLENSHGWLDVLMGLTDRFFQVFKHAWKNPWGWNHILQLYSPKYSIPTNWWWISSIESMGDG